MTNVKVVIGNILVITDHFTKLAVAVPVIRQLKPQQVFYWTVSYLNMVLLPNCYLIRDQTLS